MTLVQSLRAEARECAAAASSKELYAPIRNSLALIGLKMGAAADRIEELERQLQRFNSGEVKP